ncbi:MAG: carboxypeptidase regulatory-like domain-containing protein, partial [Acidobacteria bacterium]|nr:carboxypeptidase regulatory-like domain-containing protein [Acidobacteriota bacterium]
MPKPKDTLDRINTNKPCTADWDEMIGNEQVRFCSHCSLSVHNLSAMTRKEAMRLVIKSKGNLCARYVRRPDGRVQTTDLVLHQIGAVKRRASRLAAGAFTAALSLSASLVAAAPASAQTTNETVASTEMVQGRIKVNSVSGATLTGIIKDPNGAVIAGANVKLVNEVSAFSVETTTNDEGVYLFQSVEEGSYTLKIEASGFMSREVNNVALNSGSEINMD